MGLTTTSVRLYLKVAAVGAAAAVAAWGLLWLASVVYADHQKITQVWELEVRRAQAVAAQTPPPGGSK